MTEEEKKAAEALALATAQGEKTESEVKIEALEAEKAALIEREANYKLAYLKEKKKNEETVNLDESDEEKFRRIAREEMANERLTAIDKEKEELYQKTIRENKELKLAIQNKSTNIPTGGGASTEQPVVTSTIITPEQLAAFKARGWTDKDIERYKRTYIKNTR